MIIYKVVSLRQQTFSKGSITSFGLEIVLNEWSSKGWIFDKVLDFESRSLGGGKDYFFLVFYKKVDFPNDLYLQINNQTSPNPISEKEFRQYALNKVISPSTASLKKGENTWKPLIQTAPELVDFIEFLQAAQS